MGECVICQSDMYLDENESSLVSIKPLPCGHIFHLSCMRESLVFSNKCPLCREWLNRERAVRPHTMPDDEEDELAHINDREMKKQRIVLMNLKLGAAKANTEIERLALARGETTEGVDGSQREHQTTVRKTNQILSLT